MDRARNLDWNDSFSPYRRHAERWALRVAFRIFGGLDWTHHEVFAAIKEIMGMDPRVMRVDEVAPMWERVAERLRSTETLPAQADGPLFENARALGSYLGLTPPEEETLLLRVMARLYGPLRAVLTGVGECDEFRLADVIAIALGRPADEIRPVLRPDSTLLASGLLRMESSVLNPIERLSPLPGLSGILTRPYDSFEKLFDTFVRRALATTLRAEDFAHLDGKLGLLASYLANVCTEKSKGRNVLLYGVPGTGKTELARLAAQTAGLRLYEAEVCSEEGQPYGVTRRLHALMFLQRMVQRAPDAVALIDEIEDVFKPPEGPEPEKRTVTAADSKGWTVRLLETNPTPTIWISNRVSHIDPAVLRRFDLVMEVPVPPLTVRRRILERALGSELQPGPGIERILRDMAPAPALLVRAASVLSVVSRRSGGDPVRDLETIVRGYLAVLGQRPENAPLATTVPFDPKYLNSSAAPGKILAALRDGHANRLLLFGPSGSGKTAFAHHISAQLGVPLVTATVRDLVSELAGWTEHNLRRAFEHAQRDGAILLLDQVDWLVWAPFDHRPAHEQKTLDQLYACLDGHAGVVICTTTRNAGIEPGVVRRFPLRMRLDYLKSAQLSAFLGHLLGDDIAASAIAEKLPGLGAVTAGDMVAAVHQRAGSTPQNPEELLASLADCQRLKLGVTGTRMGFVGS